MFTLASSTQLSARANVTFAASTSKISASSSSSQMASPTKISTTTISKVLEGKVVSRANEKTAIVLIERKVPHPRFIKRINKSKRFAVHDEENDFDSFERPSSRESIATLRTSARPPRAVRARKASEFGARSHLARSTFRAKGLSRWLPRASWTRSRTRKSR